MHFPTFPGNFSSKFSIHVGIWKNMCFHDKRAKPAIYSQGPGPTLGLKGFHWSNMHSPTFKRLFSSHIWHLLSTPKMDKIVPSSSISEIFFVLLQTWQICIFANLNHQKIMPFWKGNRSTEKVWLVTHCSSLKPQTMRRKNHCSC